MAGLSSRWITLLCFCLLSQQFAPVYMAHLSKNGLVKSKRSEEEDEPDQEEQEESQAHHGDQKDSEDNALQKRGKFTTFVKWAWKGIKKTMKAAEKISDVASITSTVLRAIGGCEKLGVKGIDALWEQHKQLVTEYDDITKNIDENILAAYNMRDSANYSYLMHYDVRQEMERLVTEQNYAFEAMDPRFKQAINNETYNLKQMIKKKQENGEEVSLLEVDRGYKEGLDLALSLAIPSLSLAMPYASKLFKHLKNGVIGRNIEMLEDKFGKFKILKSTPSDTKKLLRGYQRLGEKTTSKGLLGRISKMITGMKGKYRRVTTIVNGIKTGFKAIVSLGSTALEVWTTIQTYDDCYVLKSDAQTSVGKMKEFIQENNKLLEDAKSTVDNTKQALKDIYDVAWDPDLLEALKMIKKMVEDEAISKPRPKATEIIKSIEDYLAGSLDNHKDLFSLQDNLRIRLQEITYTLTCFTTKGTFRKNVNNMCAEGRDTFDEAYDLFVGGYDYPEKLNDCRESSGELFITRKKLKDAWDKAAEQNSTVNKVCLMNNEQYVEGIKEALMDGETDPTKIAKSLFLQGHKGVNEEIAAAVETFPSVKDLPLSENLRKSLCLLKKFKEKVVKREVTAAEMIDELHDGVTDREMSEKVVEDAMKKCKQD